MKRTLFIGMTALLALVLCGSEGFSQVLTGGSRIPQTIVINGQQVPGAYVMAAAGGVQSFTCAAPQPYVTADGASQGWACYEPATGVWLLNALPPTQTQVAPVAVPQSTVIYQQAPATVIYQEPPVVVYRERVRPVVVRPAYPPSVVFGTAAINAAGRIASAATINSHHPDEHRYVEHHDAQSVHGRQEHRRT